MYVSYAPCLSLQTPYAGLVDLGSQITHSFFFFLPLFSTALLLLLSTEYDI